MERRGKVGGGRGKDDVEIARGKMEGIRKGGMDIGRRKEEEGG